MSSSYVLYTGTASTEEDVQITRMLSVLARGGVNSYATELTPLQAVEELGLGSAEAETLTQLLDDQGMLNPQFATAGGFQADEVLYPSSTGKELLATYRRVGARGADVRSLRYLAANKAILRWRDDDKNRAVLQEISGTPYGYFYGDSFKESELTDAFNNLVEHGLLTAMGSFQDKTLGLALTSKGKQCVIRYDADFEAFEAASRSTGVNNTYNVGSVGNFVAGDNHGTMNAWTQVQNPQDAAALLAAAVRIASLNGDFEGDERSEAMAKECHDDLLEAASTDTPPEQRQRLGEKIRSLASSAVNKGTETAASVLATQGVTALISVLTGIPVG
ncbi:hypothetical protein E4J89_17110 [Arthrobacter sp. CAU 1506]|uniref:hypothetical protein n=1 Tax=Arthrobacter sp. CAU 1506 TaxID=2560052 RepID=UPI0010AD8BDE|nr:hypothetical protein [Arthrobacter sp. CAU 1506]TJY66201.1 hypothetical protein E4J89_17110 [Arthrobacter sp. CAU 1506]